MENGTSSPWEVAFSSRRIASIHDHRGGVKNGAKMWGDTNGFPKKALGMKQPEFYGTLRILDPPMEGFEPV